MDTRQIKGGFGEEILSIDLRNLDDAALREIGEVFARNGLVLIRGQSIETADYVRLGATLGELVPHTRLDYTVPEQPEIYVLSNKKVGGKPIGAHFDGMGWHSDGTFLRRPLAATLLHALDVPVEGGDTLFADTCSAFADLPDDVRQRLERMRVVHSFTYLMETRFPDYEITEQQRQENPEVSHPLVLTRPLDGRKSLYMSNNSAKGIEGMSDEAARAFVAELTRLVTQDRYVYRHRWRAGDILIWNNLCTMHTATLYDDDRYLRHLHRLWVRAPASGIERPVLS